MLIEVDRKDKDVAAHNDTCRSFSVRGSSLGSEDVGVSEPVANQHLMVPLSQGSARVLDSALICSCW